MQILLTRKNKEVRLESIRGGQSFLGLSQNKLEKITLINYESLRAKFNTDFGQRRIESVITEEVLTFS